MGRFHPAGERFHPGPVRGTAPQEVVRFLVHMARWVAPVGGGALLISGGIYAGPVSVIPAPILFCLAACAFAVDTTAPVGGVR
uniref:hypothetical protein n=1 Tax=Nocardiopsis sp. 25L-1-1c TaxID=1009683 RepID=UPI0034A0C31B